MPDTVNLKKSFSVLNERLGKQFDESGVRRSFTVPYIAGQPMADHIKSVGQAAAQVGGFTKNLMTTAHHSDGKGWGSADGHTIAHPADKLRATIIPKDDEYAKASIAAAQKHINNFKFLLGDKNPAVVTAQSQLDLVKKTSGAGMNLMDFGVLLTQIMVKPTQNVAQAHSGTKSGGHSPQLRAPLGAAPAEGESQPAPSGAPQGGVDASEAPQTAQAAPSAPAAAPTPQQAAAAPAVQG